MKFRVVVCLVVWRVFSVVAAANQQGIAPRSVKKFTGLIIQLIAKLSQIWRSLRKTKSTKESQLDKHKLTK